MRRLYLFEKFRIYKPNGMALRINANMLLNAFISLLFYLNIEKYVAWQIHVYMY